MRREVDDGWIYVAGLQVTNTVQKQNVHTLCTTDIQQTHFDRQTTSSRISSDLSYPSYTSTRGACIQIHTAPYHLRCQSNGIV